MVSTRSSSSRAAKAAVVSHAEAEDDSLDEYDFEYEIGEEGDGIDIDELEPSATAPSAKSIGKRKRTTLASTSRGTKIGKSTTISASNTASKSPSKKARTRSKQPSEFAGFLDLPLELHYEIFCYLFPKDLLTLLVVNKAIGERLRDPVCPSWKEVRKSYNVPDPTPVFSEVKWMQLLHGSTKCQLCHRGVAYPTIDFKFGRRICNSCFKTNTIRPSQFKRFYPDEDVDMLELIPISNCRTYTQSIWIGDIEEMSQILDSYQTNIDGGIKGARKELEAYKDEQRKLMIALNDYDSSQYHYVSIRSSREVMADHPHWTILEDFLVEAGYNKLDIKSLRNEPGASQRVTRLKRLNRTLLQRLQGEFADSLRYKMTARLRKDYSIVLADRKDILKKLYDDYQKSISPKEWITLPHLSTISDRIEFAKHLLAEGDVVVSASSFGEAMRNLPDFINASAEEKRRDMGSSLIMRPKYGSSLEPHPIPSLTAYYVCGDMSVYSSPPIKLPPPPNFEHYINLAAAIFRSRECACISIEDVFRSHNAFTSSMSYRDQLHYDEGASKVAAKLVELAGLDVEVATPQNMDDIEDLLFTCNGSQCELQSFENGQSGLKVYGWREFIHHATIRQEYPSNIYGPSNLKQCSPASRVEKQGVVALIKPVGKISGNQDNWTCAHCPSHHNAWVTLQEVKDHVRTTHLIRLPKKGVDYILAPSEIQREHYNGYIPTTARARTWLCLVCTGMATEQNFTKDGVISHCKAVHYCNDPQEGVEYKNREKTPVNDVPVV